MVCGQVLMCGVWAGCGSPVAADHSYVASSNGSWALYACLEGYRHLSGDLVRQCVNATWTGLSTTCTVDSEFARTH